MTEKDVNASQVPEMDRKSAIPTEFSMEYKDSRKKKKQGVVTYDQIGFKRGLPQGVALSPRLFTLTINPVSWKLKATEGYKLSNPINMQVTHLLFIEDLKI